MKAPVRVTITGAAGQIGYQLAFRIASGQLFGPNQPVVLQLLEITPAMDALAGVAMELEDCAFDSLQSVVISDDAATGFKDADTALLVGAGATIELVAKHLTKKNIGRLFVANRSVERAQNWPDGSAGSRCRFRKSRGRCPRRTF